jgi:hypothetical protein
VTFSYDSDDLVRTPPPPPAASPAVESDSPSSPTAGSVTSRPVSAVPTVEPTRPPGPPFPAREPDAVLIDAGALFTAATEELAAQQIAALKADDSANVVVYTQVKPGTNAASTQRDAVALTLQWRLPETLVIMWNAGSGDCGNGESADDTILLYAGTRFSATRLSELKRRQIVDDFMQPFLQQCLRDAALLAALEGIAMDIKPPTSGTGTTGTPPSTKGACGDPEYKLAGYRWDKPFEWFLEESSLPEFYDSDEVLELLIRSAENITSARNDCGLPDKVDADAVYAGTTSATPCDDESGDGVNTVGFGELPDDVEEDTIAFVCPYGTRTSIDEVDMLINATIPWALSEAACKRGQELLEATITHEFGHIFGLSHVSERQHGDLTMSPTSNGPCDPEEITLGLGDVLGLQELY